MIPSPTEIASSIYGAWRLAHLDKTALQYFNRTVEGFWRSFFAAVIVLPGHAILIASELSDATLTADLPQVLVIQGLVYVLAWTVFPLVMFHVTQAMGRSGEYVGYIVAANWVSVLEIALYAAVIGIAKSGLLPEGLGTTLTFAVFLVILAFEAFVAHTLLRIGGMAAGGVVLLSLFIFYVIDGVGMAMIS